MPVKRDHIDQKIAESFNSQERKAPTGMWSNIAKTSALTSDELVVKESFSSSEKTAPKKGWKNIKRQLIIDDVWSNILAFQEKKRRRAIIWWFSGSFATILLIIGVAWNYSTDDSSFVRKQDFQAKGNSDVNSVKGGELNITSKDKLKNGGNKKQFDQVNEETTKVLNFNVENVKDGTEAKEVEQVEKNQISKDSGESVQNPDESEIKNSSDYISQLKTQPLNLEEDRHLAESQILDYSLFRKFEVGISLSASNTWLFNNDVKNGLNSNSLVHNKLSTGYSIGLDAAFNFNSSILFM